MEKTPEDQSEAGDRSDARNEPEENGRSEEREPSKRPSEAEAEAPSDRAPEAEVPGQDEDEAWLPATETTEEPAAPAQDQTTEVTSRRRRTAGVILIVLGVLFVLDNYFDIGDWTRLWPLLLILLGVVLIARSRKA